MSPMKLVVLVALGLLAAGTSVAAAPTAAAEGCDIKECASGEAGPCEYGWRWAGTTDEQGFWYPYVECDV